MTADRIISRYNHMNGNSVTVAKLKEFHADIQQHLDANGHGPGVPELKEIHGRVAKAIKNMIARHLVIADKVNIAHPIKIKAPVKKSAKRKAKKNAAIVDDLPAIDKELIYGLEKLPKQKIEG